MSSVSSTSAVDWQNLHAWAAGLNSGLRDRLAAALRDIQGADDERRMVDTVRAVLVREQLGRSAVGVVFTTSSWDNGYFLTSAGTVLCADGSTIEVDFDDIDEIFTDAIGVCGPDFGLSINVRTGEVDTDDYADNLYAAFRPCRRQLRPAIPVGQGDQPAGAREQTAA